MQSVHFKLLIFCLVLVGTSGRIGFGPTDQDWGYVSVRSECHMFWWLHYAMVNNATEINRPLIVWLQGGPGGSSVGQGTFMASGPLDLDQQPRSWAWTNRYNMLYVDSPIGAGFSYTTNEGFAKNSSMIASDFVELMKGFLKQHPEFETVPLYIHGESYGGKSAVYITQALLQAAKEGHIKVNLKGMSLVYPAVATVAALEDLGTRLFYMGALDQQERDEFNAVGKQMAEAYSEGNMEEATLLADQLMSRATFDYSLSSHAVTDNDVYEILNMFERLDELMNTKVGPALNVSTNFGAQKPMVLQSLTDTFVQCIDIVEEILNESNLTVFVYGGQLDWMLSAHETYKWVKNLNWDGKANFEKAKRTTIVVDGVHEGYEKIYDRLGYFWINRAGHRLPGDNPNAMTYATEKHFG